MSPDRITPEKTSHLEGRTLEERVAAKDAVLDISETAGLAVIKESFKSAAEQKLREVVNRMKPFVEPADYEAILGEVRGLESFEAIVDGLIMDGEEAENEIREKNTRV